MALDASQAFDKLRHVSDDVARDAYGFEVKKEVLSLFRRFQPLWAEEEAERSRLWSHFVRQLQRDLPEGGSCDGEGGTTAAAAALQSVLSHYDNYGSAAGGGSSGSADPTPEVAARMEQLRTLVQAGVPMACRGKYWQLFLKTASKRKPGLYAELIEQALDQSPWAVDNSRGGNGGGNGVKTQAEEHDVGDEGKGQAGGSKQDPATAGASLGVGSLGLPVVEIFADGTRTGAVGTTAGAAAGLVRAAVAASRAAGPSPAACTSPPAAGGAGVLVGDSCESQPQDHRSQQQQQQQQQQQHATFTVTSADIHYLSGRQEAAHNSSTGDLQTSPNSQAAGAAADCKARDAERCVSPDSGGSYYSSDECHSSGAESLGSWRAKDWLSQIEKDLHRTFPGHPLMDASGREALRRILAAYARYNSRVGYCQGMNFIAACFMLFMGEEEAFWCVAAVVEDLLPGYFDTRMVSPQVDQRVFGHLLQASFPTLMAHLQQLEVDASSVSMQWFLCMFVNSLPLETCLRVWDMLFFEGSPVVLLRVALALVDVYQKVLLECRECSDAYMLLQSMGPMTFDSSRLLDTACIGFGYIKDSALRVLRAKYRTPVLEQLRGSFGSDEDFRAYAYYGAAEPTHSRSQSFADAFARMLAAGSPGSAGSPPQNGNASPGSTRKADQGHLTISPSATSAGTSPGDGRRSSSPGGVVEACKSSSARHGSMEGGSSSSSMSQPPPAATAGGQPVSAKVSARLVPSSLPRALPSGALGPLGEELPPQLGMSTSGSQRAAQTRGLRGISRKAEGDSSQGARVMEASGSREGQQPLLEPSQPELLEQAGSWPGGRGVPAQPLPRISTQRSQRAAQREGSSPAQQQSSSAGTGVGAAAPWGGRRLLSPFTDPSTMLAAGSRALPTKAMTQPRNSVEAAAQPFSGLRSAQEATPSGSESANIADPANEGTFGHANQLAYHSQEAPSSVPAKQPSLAHSPSRHHRRSQSAQLPGQQSSPAAAQRQQRYWRHRYRRRPAVLPDLHRLATFVPDLQQPAVAAAYRIASKPSQRSLSLGASMHESGALLPAGSLASHGEVAMPTTPSSLLAGSSASQRSSGVAAAAAAPRLIVGMDEAAADGLPGKDGLPRELQFDMQPSGHPATQASDSCPDDLLSHSGPPSSSPPSCVAHDIGINISSPLLPARGYTDSEVAYLRSLLDQPFLEGDQWPAGEAGGFGSTPWPACTSVLRQGLGATGLAAAQQQTPERTSQHASCGQDEGPLVHETPVGVSSSKSCKPGTPVLTPATPTTAKQLLAVIERLQEEVVTAESLRHVAELAARQAGETHTQLQRQLAKLQQSVAEKEVVLADLRGKLAAISSELAEAEGELCAGRMAVEQLTRQVDNRQQQLAEKDELIRLLMDRACNHSHV